MKCFHRLFIYFIFSNKKSQKFTLKYLQLFLYFSMDFIFVNVINLILLRFYRINNLSIKQSQSNWTLCSECLKIFYQYLKLSITLFHNRKYQFINFFKF